jgi:2-(1,2-epoxy-1,2-dihydrophenyl)acetyl-CoA isomerase
MHTHGDVGVHVGDDHVAIVEIWRPPDNFFDAGLICSIADAYDWAEEQAGARAIVLCSQGKNFCAGANFNARGVSGGVGPGGVGPGSAGPGGVGGGVRELYDQALRLFEAKLPVVAAVQGVAVGGGLGLACSADFRVASPWSRFAANFARLGLHQGFGLSVTLPAIVGQQMAMDLLYTGRRLDGEEALRIGLVDRLADDRVAASQVAGETVGQAGQPSDADHADLRAVAHELARQIAGSAPLAVRSIRATLRAGLADRVRQAMDAELAEQGRLWQTADFAEGVRAYAERRPPRFEGR